MIGRLLSKLVLMREKLWVLLLTVLQAVSQGLRRSCTLSPLPSPLGLLSVCPSLLSAHLLPFALTHSSHSGVNIGDFSRYCKKPSASYIQLLVFPILYAGLSFFASITASCASYVYGSENSYYQPYDIVVSTLTSLLLNDQSLTNSFCH